MEWQAANSGRHNDMAPSLCNLPLGHWQHIPCRGLSAGT